jgi:hypothetical protein
MQITWLPQRRDYFIAYAVTIAIGLLLTQPSESRSRRWVQILISVAVVHFGLYALSAFEAVRKPDFIGIDDSGGYIKSVSIFLCVAGALAVIWTGCLTDIGALVFEFLLDSPDNRGLPQERIEKAFALLNAGKKWRARRMAGICVREDRGNFNTRLAAARVFMLTHSFWRARWHCYYILLKRRSSPAYRFGARHLLDEIRASHPSRLENLFLRKPQKIRLR